MKRVRRGLIFLAGLGVLGYLGLIFWGQPKIEQSANKLVPHAPFPVSERAKALHQTLTIADLHSDSTLWARDLAKESGYGHVDIPRLAKGNVAVQMFTSVTKSPKGQNYQKNEDGFDMITVLSLAQLWPVSTWTSLKARALHQAESLHRTARKVPERFRVVTSKQGLKRALADRAQNSPGLVLGLLGIEGLHCLEGKIETLDEFYNAGFRMMGLHHFFDNETGGSLHGVSGKGLTPLGKAVVMELDRRSIIIDLAHASEASVRDILDITTRPCVVSHTGVAGFHKSPRNISDGLMKKIAGHGGLVGIGYWEGAVGDIRPANIVRAIAYAVDLLGEDHVCLGSDFDGSTTMAFDTSELAALTHEMLEQGFTEERIRKVMGENTLRFLAANLPD